MKLELKDGDLELQGRAIVKLPDAAGVNIVCRDGAVWITLDNDVRDIVLEPGQSFTAQDHRPAMIYALRPSSIGVSSPQ